MRKHTEDLQECMDKIQEILEEYNCEIDSSYDYSHAFLRDKDTDETISFGR
ncbi:hypothetical protein XaC1_446 [Xanthomonas phage XaC1]|nr:hypothetical protein XaC1_446 [Xanthomonas phage XaC1]